MIKSQQAAPNVKRGAPDTVFSPKLYALTLARLWPAGLLLTIACLLLTLSQLLPALLGPRSPYEGLMLGAQTFGDAPTFFALLSPAALMMQTFFFLYKRNGSDLYHGLPYTRRSLGLSLTAASLTWAAASVTLPLALCAVFIGFSPLQFPMALLWWMLASHLATILLVTGCAFIGVSLSGTPLAGVAIAGLVLFLPRWAMTIYRYFLADVSRMMVYNDAGGLLSPSLHLPTANLVLLARGQDLARFLGKTYAQFFHNIPGILYTLAAGAATLGIGLLCFIRRRSELAGQSLAGPRGRYALHAALALTAMLWGVYFLYQGHKRAPGNWLLSSAMIVAAGMVAGGLALYFAWHRLRGKSWRGAAQAAPFMALAVVCGVAVCAGGVAAGFQARSGMPELADVVSVRFPAEPGDYPPFFGFSGNRNQRDLLSSQVGGVVYDSPEMLRLAASAVSARASTLDQYTAGQIEYLPGGQEVTMELTLRDGGTLRRTVQLDESLSETLQQLLLDSPEFIAALRQVPEQPLVIMSALDTFALPEDEDTRAIWRTAKEELKGLSDLDFMRQTALRYSLPGRGPEYYQEYEYPASLSAFEWRGTELYQVWYAIGYKTGETLAACVREANRRLGPAYRKALEAAEALDFTQDIAIASCYYSISFSYQVEKDGRTLQRVANLYPLPIWSDRYDTSYATVDPPDPAAYNAFRDEQAKTMQEILLRSPLAEDGKEPIVIGNAGVSAGRESVNAQLEPAYGNAYLKVGEDDIAALIDLVQRLEELETGAKVSNG